MTDQPQAPEAGIMAERCPYDGQTMAWHLHSDQPEGRTNGEFIGCDWVEKIPEDGDSVAGPPTTAQPRPPVTRAQPDAGTLRGAVQALHGGTHWCFDADEQSNVYELGTQWWPCPTLALLAEHTPELSAAEGAERALARVRALADEWERKANEPTFDHVDATVCRTYQSRAMDLRAALAPAPGEGDGGRG